MKTTLWKTTVGMALAIALAACGGSTFATSQDGGGGGTNDSGSGGSGDSGAPSNDGGVPSDSGGGHLQDSGGGAQGDTGTGEADSGSGATDSGTGPKDAGGPTVCPPSAPPAGESCNAAGIECEYGTNPNPACNDVFQCTAGAWAKEAQLGCVMGTCPSSYASVPMTGTCTPLNLECAYPQGTCLCSTGSLPRVGGPTWTCFPVMTGCPSPRPDLGSPCSDDNLECNYGACNGGVELQCTNGTWQDDPMVACPAIR